MREEMLLKKEDKVVMHTCIDSEGENYGKIWTCESDEFIENNECSVWLKGYKTPFPRRYLQKVELNNYDPTININQRQYRFSVEYRNGQGEDRPIRKIEALLESPFMSVQNLEDITNILRDCLVDRENIVIVDYEFIGHSY